VHHHLHPKLNHRAINRRRRGIGAITRAAAAMVATVLVGGGMIAATAATATAAPGEFAPNGSFDAQIVSMAATPTDTSSGQTSTIDLAVGNNAITDMTAAITVSVPDGYSVATTPDSADCTGAGQAPTTLSCAAHTLAQSGVTTLTFDLTTTATNAMGGSITAQVAVAGDVDNSNDTQSVSVNTHATIDASGNFNVDRNAMVTNAGQSANFNSNNRGDWLNTTVTIDGDGLTVSNIGMPNGFSCTGLVCTDSGSFNGTLNFNFTLTAPGTTGTHHVTITISAGNDPGSPRVRSQDVTVATAATVTGRVLDAVTGTPLPNICVYGGQLKGNGGGGKTVTNPTGFYSMLVPAGTPMLLQYADCSKTPTYANSVYHDTTSIYDVKPVVAEGTTALLDQHLRKGYRISGHVNSTGNPGGEQNVQVEIANAAGSAQNVAGTNTDQSGNYQTNDLLPAGSYLVSFSTGGYATEWYSNAPTPVQATPVSIANANVTGIDASLTAETAITGKITSAATGNPIQNVCVEAYPKGHVSVVNGAIGSANTDSSGNYTLNGLGVASYNVVAYDCDGSNSPAYAPRWYGGDSLLAHAGTITTTTGATTGIDIALSTSTRTVSGTIRAASTNDPIANSCAIAFSPGVGVATQGGSDANGHYTVGGLAPDATYYAVAGTCQNIGPEGFEFAWYDGHLGAPFSPFNAPNLDPVADGALALPTRTTVAGINIWLGALPNPTITVQSIQTVGNVVKITLLRTGQDLSLVSSVHYDVVPQGLTASSVSVTGADFSPTSGTASFGRGVATFTISVPVLANPDRTTPRSFDVVLSAAVNAVIARQSARVTGAIPPTAGTTFNAATPTAKAATPVAAPAGSLAYTGNDVRPSIAVGLGAILLGFLAVFGSRRRRLITRR
jgi:5-hydroxyisourate hydrolase-like protein (transthyretin family)